ncbi:diguanylate cyclase domain-containing protein, partial [Hyphomonas sp.]|uniref:diguanylate cyclase domain-containing protein n=1 Tax=Hyphomonas sp. TaxID=87 RepID=UPI00391967E6
MKPAWPSSPVLRSLKGFLQPVEVPPEHLDGLRSRQVQSIRHLVSIMLLVGLLNTAIVVIMLNSIGTSAIALVWGFSLIMVNGLSLLHYFRSRKHQHRPEYADRKIRGLRKSSAIHGTYWGMLPLLVTIGSTDDQFMMIATITAGMLFGGTFLLSRVPSAALCFLAPVAVGIVSAAFFRSSLASDLLGVLALVYVFVLTYAVRWAHRQFVQQYLSQVSLHEQSQLIALLLRDFGENSSDWLWQTDKDFYIEPMPCSQQAESKWHSYLVSGRSLFSLFEGGEGYRALKSALLSGQPFKDIELSLRGHAPESVWISLTGKPVFSGGQLRGYRGVAQDITLARNTEKRVEKLAHFDELTGLPNRANLLSHLDRILANPPKEGIERALLVMDLDKFKVVNDTLGHQAADHLLRQVTNRLTESSLSTDFVARIASDGFAMVVDRSTGRGLDAFLDNLVRYLAEPYSVWDATIVCSASIGVQRIDALRPKSGPLPARVFRPFSHWRTGDASMIDQRRRGFVPDG